MRLLIVDDEAPITAYISDCIRQAGERYEIVGSVSRGKAALNLLASEKVDVVLADITMPKMNGLEMLSIIRQSWPETQVVMLTCHNDFEYVRKSMQYGAADYILKNEINPQSMKALLERLVAKRRKEMEKENGGNLALIQYLIKALADDSTDLLSKEDLRQHQMPRMELDCFAMVFKYNKPVLDNLAVNQRTWMIGQLVFSFNHNQIAVVSSLPDTMGDQEKTEKMSALRSELQKHCGTRIGISRIHRGGAYLKRAILEAIFDNDRAFFHQPDQNSEVDHEESLKELFILRNNAITAINDGRIHVFRQNMEQIFQQVGDRCKVSVARLKRMLLAIVRSIADHSLEPHIRSMERKIEDADYFNELEKLFEEFADTVEAENQCYSSNIAGAVAYIREHFRENITLQDAAGSVFLNSEYFSRRFKKEVGMNFSEYLLELRMEEAMRLIQNTRLKIVEVSEQVGISSVSYFAQVFRKRFNISPNEIRKK
ncbi:MAG: two-component system response regulator [Bacillota bacterium]|jgi:YesN/AraC family two-component response regulator|nr:two-component system response regulator [Bacillota bacterium]